MSEEKDQKSDVAKREEKTLKFWQENKIFEKSLEQTKNGEPFIFYEGPPTANGRPGIHHLEARAFKDVIPRFKTMQGYHVRRKAGWDTHGLPVELEVEKELGLKNKKEIEEYGVAEFNKKCKESVWRYVDEWKKFTDRISFWVDKEDAYVTYKPQYIESIWHIVSYIWDKGLLFKDYKVVPWCPRCGTAVSSHEVAQGYKEVEDTSVYVKFELKDEPGTFVVAWTTTPWTLPGNVALAVRSNLTYIKVLSENTKYILVKEKVEEVFEGKTYKVLAEMSGRDLIGKPYEPLFDYFSKSIPQTEKDKLNNAYKIYPADFVSTEDGSGVVHTAVMYGQEDFELGNEIGLPKYHLVDENGKFTKDVPEYEGVFVKDADEKVLEDLDKKGLVFKTTKTKHTYPFCWRCQSPLIYYARDSWYIRMSKLRDELVSENQKIHWEPEHLKEGRFGEWLRDIKDWAISRERYWGTPLPIWECQKCDKRKVVGSIQDLEIETGKNKYFVIRHGGAKSNAERYLDSGEDESNHVTKEGRVGVLESAKRLKKENIDLIISSPVLRTKETAEILNEEIGVEVIFDERIKEKNFGDYSGKPIEEYSKLFSDDYEKFETRCPNGESRNDIRKRMGEFLYEIDKKYSGKTILIVSHGTPIHLLFGVAQGKDTEFLSEDFNYFKNAEVRPMTFSPLPHNDLYELDLHRPYIDEVKLKCSCGSEMSRVKEVMDVWFDSGAMPFAQDHYPFENKDWVEGKGFPADYISEAIDQTRGWFYTLHAIGVLMDKGLAYKNVISLGHIMDKHGRKMSKSVGNTVDPWEEIDKYGSDVLRFWMYTVNQPGESKNYDRKTVEENLRKVVRLLDNIYRFYETYSEDAEDGYGEENILDKWILSKLRELVEKNTDNLESYKVLEPARRIRDFINDLSTWYIRRSRDRFKGEDEKDRRDAIKTTRYVLLELSKLMAPLTPLLAEDIYKKVGGEKESVHLDNWPKSEKADEEVLEKMEKTRKLVSLALEARASAGIKVRQPLSELKVREKELERSLVEVLKEEVNIKKVSFVSELNSEIELDTNITPELQEEGDSREFIRAIQNLRKEEGLKPSDIVSLKISSDGDLSFVNKFEDEIKRVCGLNKITKEGGEKEIKIRDISIKIGILKNDIS